MLNRDVFQVPPEAYRIPNDGVAKIIFPPAPGAPTETLKDELRTFVTDGEFGRGLLRVLESFRSGLSHGSQKAVWISGFYGSGKSHLAKMLCALWTDQAFSDGSRPSALIPEPPAELVTELRALRSAAERAGGLHAAGGTLGGGTDDPKLATLGIVLQSVGLPLDFRATRVAFWLADEGILDAVRTRLGSGFDSAIRNFVLSTAFHQAVIAEKPSLAANARDLSDRLKDNFRQPPEITVNELSSTVRRALLLGRKELPLTLVVLDEIQQFLKNDPSRVLDMQNIAERFAEDFDGRLLLVGTGQQALNELENLQKLLGRFQVRINLGEADMDSVIRKTVLRKSSQGADHVRDKLDECAGEISRELRGTRVAHRAEDNGDAVLDWPLLPSRRRVWERVLRVLDRSGMAGALRTQMAVALESARLVAGKPLGHAVPADFLYTRFADDAFAAGELPEETRARITKLREGSEAERLQARVLMLVYMLGLIQGDAEFHGVRATAETLADLLIENLEAGGDVRGAVPAALTALEESGAVMQIDGVWRLQTKEAAEWDAAYRAELRGVRNNPSELASRRRAALDAALSDSLKGLSAIPQGRSAVSRKIVRLGPDEKAPADGLTVRVHSGWDETLRTVVAEIAAQPDTDATIHLLIERQDAERLEEAVRQRQASQTVLDQRGAPSTAEGDQAQKAMAARLGAADRMIKEIVGVAVREAKVLLAGGSEQLGASLKDRVQTGALAALVRLYPQFDTGDDPGWERVVKNAQAGQGAPLRPQSRQTGQGQTRHQATA
ncbi:MAG: BREX system P-loop protein BrxC [Bryobacteraceae bacterium]